MTSAPGAAGLRAWPLAALLAALAVLLALSPLTWRADRLWQDLLVAANTRPPPADTLIVAIDDASIAALGRWPWPRTVHATLLRQMAAAGPRSITLDLVLSEPEPVADPWLAAEVSVTTARGIPVLMPVSWQAGPAGLAVLLPTPALQPGVRLGAAEAAVDADGVLRHLFLQAGPADAPYPHLARAVLEAGGGRLHPSLRPAWNTSPEPGRWQRDGRLLLRFGGPPGSVPRVSAVELLQGRVEPARLAGRDLLLGLTAQGLGDTLATPVNAGHRAMPGVEVLAQGLALLRHGDGPQLVAPAVVAGGAAAALVLLLALMQRLGERHALGAALGVVPLALLASAGSAWAGWLWSPLPFVLPALLAYPLWSWLRLRRALQLLALEIRALASAGGAPAPAAADAKAAPVAGLEPQLAALQHAGAQLRAAHRDQATLLEGLPTAVLVGDAAGRVRLGNALAASLFEVDGADELQGLDLARLMAELQGVPPREAADWQRLLDTLPELAEGSRPEGLALELRRGPRELLLHARALHTAAGRHTLVSLADLAAVREAQRAREQALAFVSHDLRGPAATIVLLARLHAEGRAGRSADALMPELQGLAQRTLDLADDFVLAARAGTRPLQPQAQVPAQLVDQARRDLGSRAAAAGIELHTRVDEAALGSRAWQLDARLVARALTNLLDNALAHTPAGGRVRLSAGCEGEVLVFEVADSGPGLADAQRRALAAQQAPASARPGGSGFGLAFVQQVAARHAGWLQAADADAAWPGARLRLGLRDAPPEGGALPAGSGNP